MKRWINGQMDRQIDRKIVRQKEIDRKTYKDRQIDRQKINSKKD